MLSNCFKAEEMERNSDARMNKMMQAMIMMLASSSLLLGDGVSAQQTENSVVQIAVAMPGGSPTNFGTGFFIRDDGLIATASHVYLKALSAIVDARAGVVVARRFSRTNRGQWVGAAIQLVAQDYQHDVVLLKMQSADPMWKQVGGVVPLLLDDGAMLEDGTQVCMRGYFGSDDFPVFLKGATAGTAGLGPSLVQELLIVLPVVPGQSGSPLMSVETGRVVGVLTAIVPVSLPFNQQPAHSGLARAVEVVHVKRLVESLGK
jgi:S1-C subfamily serine protease